MIDHINGVRSDNRIANLREVSCLQNLHGHFNKPVSCIGLRGVHKADSAKNPYRALISFNGKQINLGSFDDPLKAHRAYLEAKAIVRAAIGIAE